MNASAALKCVDLSISVPGRSLVEALDFDCRPGEVLAILGPNGVGKSLTLHSLAGLRPLEKGSVEVGGRPLSELSRQETATTLALLPQYTEDIFPTTVFDTVLVGRHPHIGRLQWEGQDDRRIVQQSLELVDLVDFADRDIMTLSGGERRRVAVAQVLAQAPGIFLLDEPTNHLDPQHQLDVLRIFRKKADDGCIVVTSLHDVNLAARFADRCLLLSGEGRWQIGLTNDVLNGETLTDLYATPIESVPWRDAQVFVAV